MKKYNSRKKGVINYLMALVFALPILVLALDYEYLIENPIIFLPLIAPLAIILWVYFDTYYIINENMLRYKSGFIGGKIDIRSIEKVIVGKTSFIGLKPALAPNGIIIRHGKNKEIYISPLDNQEMINDLLAINPDIEIEDEKNVSEPQ